MRTPIVSQKQSKVWFRRANHQSREYFGIDESNDSNAIAGATSGIYTGGGRKSLPFDLIPHNQSLILQVIGAVFSSWLADTLGRKKAIFIGCVLATIGGALQAGSVAMAMFLVFRFVNGCGVGKINSLPARLSNFPNTAIGMLLALVPLYQSEVSAPHSRGFMVGFHGICVTIGYFGAR